MLQQLQFYSTIAIHIFLLWMTSNSIDEKLVTLNLVLPTLPPSKGIYRHVLEVGNLLYVSGHVSMSADGSIITGKLGNQTLSEEQGFEWWCLAVQPSFFSLILPHKGQIAARSCALAILASIKNQFGNFARIKRVVKLLGMVNATSDYAKHPIVVNGASQLFVDLLGDENGKGVRSAVGVSSLPSNAAVEIEGQS